MAESKCSTAVNDKQHDERLCSVCAGNSVTHIPGGIQFCPHCHGGGGEPDAPSVAGPVDLLIDLAERMGLRPRPLASQPVFRAPLPTVAQAWEAFIDSSEHDLQLIGATFCGWCEDEPVNGLLEHADGCPFEALDQAVARLRARP